MVKCKNCGARFSEDVNFCSICGSPVEKERDGKVKWILLGAGAAVVVVLAVILILNLLSGDDADTRSSGSSDEFTVSEGTDDGYVDDGVNDPVYDYDYDGEYILEGSDREYISESVIRGLSDEELMLARNEIYARHGRIFDDRDIREYFTSQSWYEGTIHPDDFSEDMLNEIEKENVERIVAEEARREQ